MLKLIDCQIDATGWEIKIPDIQLGKGELLVITGPSGIGKSTLLHWLLGNIPRHVNISGKILIDDIDVSQQAIERRHIGLLMQDVYLFPHLSVQDNICFALPDRKSPGVIPDELLKAIRHRIRVIALDELIYKSNSSLGIGPGRV